MQFKKTLLAMMMFGAAAAQADYQAEVGVLYSATSEEFEFDDSYGDDYDVDTDTLGVAAAVYFSPVSTANGPLDEAEFLSKASGVAFEYATADADYDYDDGFKASTDADAFTISGHFVLPNPSLIFEATYGQGENEDVDVDYYALGFGGYITDRITLMIEYSKKELDTDFGDDSDERFTVTYRQLIQLGGEMNLALEPYLSRVDYYGEDGGAMGIDAVFYLNRSLGFKAGLSGFAVEADEGDYSEGNSYIGVDYFINENFRIGGKLLSTASELDADDYYADDLESEGAGIELDASVRF